MKSVLDGFRSASPREKLGIASDVLSILGVSFAAIATAIYNNTGKVSVSAVVGIGCTVLLFIGAAALAVAFFLWLDSQMKPMSEGSVPAKLFRFALWCGFAIFALIWFLYFYDHLFNTTWT